jgi:hypothetical protein
VHHNNRIQYFSNTLRRSYVGHGPINRFGCGFARNLRLDVELHPLYTITTTLAPKHTTPLSTPPQICSPAVSSPAAPAPPRRASKQSPRGVSPRPSRSMRSLLSQSTALTVPMPPRWYVTHGHTGIAGRCRPRDTDTPRANTVHRRRKDLFPRCRLPRHGGPPGHFQEGRPAPEDP